MYIRKTFFSTTVISFLTVSLVYCQAAQKGGTDSTRISLQKVIDQHVTPLLNGETPVHGLVVGIIHGDQKEVFGYGETGLHVGDTPDGETMFRIGSVTKSLTALLLAQLVAQGKIALDDPVTPCAPTHTSSLCFEGKPATFFQLATHTSGLPSLPSNLKDGASYSMKDFQQFLDEHTLNQTPGNHFVYSTVGYAMLGLLLADKCGPEGFEACLAKEVFEPLGMTSSAFDLSEESASRLAVGYAEGTPVPQREGRVALRASGGLSATANDLLAFVSANLQPNLRPRLAKALALTHQPYTHISTFPGSVAALGWHFFAPLQFYWQGGTTSGFRTFVTFDPKNKAGVVMLANTGLPATDNRVELAGFGILGVLAASN